MKVATAYKKGNTLYLHSSSKTTSGVWIATAPFIKVEMGSTASAQGEAVFKALNASEDAVPHPTNWTSLIDPLLDLASVKSWATFMKNARCVSLESDGERLKLIPMRNLGPKDGFEPVPENTVDLSFQSSPAQVGAKLEGLLT